MGPDAGAIRAGEAAPGTRPASMGIAPGGSKVGFVTSITGNPPDIRLATAHRARECLGGLP
ncbi:MAG: hypothetical protein JWR20_824 [Marmoricola sp.]|nr:hypothetical protein [Marmoricola sp.]